MVAMVTIAIPHVVITSAGISVGIIVAVLMLATVRTTPVTVCVSDEIKYVYMCTFKVHNNNKSFNYIYMQCSALVKRVTE